MLRLEQALTVRGEAGGDAVKSAIHEITLVPS